MPTDLLLAIQDEAERKALGAILQSALKARISAHAGARAALAALEHCSVSGVVCSTILQDARWHQLATLLHSGRFGAPDVPLCVLCEADEVPRLTPLADSHTHFVTRDGGDTAQQISSILSNRPRRTVLVVEDEPLVAKLAHQALAKDFEVDIAHDGRAALALWRERRHDLVLLDLMLPDLPGLDVQRQILAVDPHQTILVLTAHPSAEHHQDMILGGATQFLSKPVDPRELLAACSAALYSSSLSPLLHQADQALNTMRSLSSRIRVANYNLKSGRAGDASQQLNRALSLCSSQPSDDEWTALLNEIPPR